MKKKIFVSLFLIIVLAAMTIPASANGTTDTPVSYSECAQLVGEYKQWSPDGNLQMRNVHYESGIFDSSDDRLSGILYGNEKVVFSHKNGKAIFQGTAKIVLPDGRGVWEGSWIGDGVLGVNWELDIVFHGKEGEVKGLKAFITTTSDPSYSCANSTGVIVNPGGK